MRESEGKIREKILWVGKWKGGLYLNIYIYIYINNNYQVVDLMGKIILFNRIKN